MNFYEFYLFESLIENLLPQQKIGSGNFADVYTTQDPNIVMRIERKSSMENCDKFMMNPKIQATGGVAKIFGMKMLSKNELFPQSKDDQEVLVTFKERVDTNWHGYLASKHSSYLKKKYNISKIIQMMHFGPETAAKFGEVSAFLQLALEAFRKKDTIIEFLSSFPEASGLISAINLGLPFDDLHSDNLGMNLNKQLVVIDC